MMQFDNSANNQKNQGFVMAAKPWLFLSKPVLKVTFNSAKRLNYKAFSLGLIVSLGLTGCANLAPSSTAKTQSMEANKTVSQKDGPKSIPASGSTAALKLGNLATTANKSEEACIEDCEAIEAVADEEAFLNKEDEALFEDNSANNAIESYEDIDSEPAILTLEDDGDDTGYNDDFNDDDDDAMVGERLGVEHVPLNAISPQTLQAFVEVIDVIRHDYVRPVNDEMLFQHAITGMLEKLDKHAEYLTPENYDNLRSFTDGEIAQVGLTVNYDANSRQWIIDSVLSQSSAQQKGIKAGDKLLRIKKVELTPDMTGQDIQQMLSGIAGSQVEITVQNKSGATHSVILQRNLAGDNELAVTLKQGVAIVRLPVFQNGSKNELIKALKQTGAPITGVVLDIRNNPGGVLSSAIDIASLFIKEGNLIQVRNRTNHGQIIKSNGTPYLSDLPVVILQNRYSASAAEALSSSFKSNNRATIVGEQSFGKGTVQEVVPLDSGGGLKLTVAEYRSAEGEQIDGVGVRPDITYEHNGSDWQQKALNLLLAKDRPFGIKFDDESDGISVIDDY